MIRSPLPSEGPTGFALAFGHLYQLAYRVAFRMLGDRGDAEDVAQEALARAAVRWNRLEDRPEGWVTRVASNLAIDRIRRRGRTSKSTDRSLGLVDPHIGERGDLVNGLRRLPRRQREAVVLRYLADLSEADVAIIMRCSEGTVKSHCSRGLAALGAIFPIIGREVMEMFEHLDDQTASSPRPGDLAGVLRRAQSIRARRRVAVVAAASVVLLGGFSGFIASRSSNAHITSVETTYAFDAVKGPLAVGTPVPTTALLNVVFTSAEDGFALVSHRGAALLALSTDGGNSWYVKNDSLPGAYGQGHGYPGQIEFVGDHGYLWGGPSDGKGSVPLWVSADSGSTWTEAPIGPTVFDVSAIGANVWAVTGNCDAFTARPCALQTQQSSDWGTSWQPTGPAGFAEVDGPVDLHSVELARITSSHSYVLTSDLPVAGGSTELFYTGDAGLTWRQLPVPCSGAFDLGAEVAASSTDDLWLLCGSQGSGGSQSKELYRSSDGGLSWALTASATGLGTPPPPASEPNSLPLDGYIAPFSIGHKNLAVASPTTAWLKPMGASMYKTSDGGRSWTVVPDLETEGIESSGQGDITFISASEGWICAYGVGLWHTSNGVSWAPLGL